MKKKKWQTIPRTKEKAIAEAKRFLKNAKEILAKVKIEYRLRNCRLQLKSIFR